MAQFQCHRSGIAANGQSLTQLAQVCASFSERANDFSSTARKLFISFSTSSLLPFKACIVSLLLMLMMRAAEKKSEVRRSFQEHAMITTERRDDRAGR